VIEECGIALTSGCANYGLWIDMMFRDRREADQKLADRLSTLSLHDPVVPRDGVSVAVEIAQALKAPLDIIIARKVGIMPGNPELALEAIIDGDPPDVAFNRQVVEACDLDDAALKILMDRELSELERSRRIYRANRHPLPIATMAVVLVNDGAATGATMKAAIRALRRRSPLEIVIALPVAPLDTGTDLAVDADRIVCLNQPSSFHALGSHYHDFHQLADEEVLYMLQHPERGGGRML
jgi:putative phosphoribosyl transferase